MIVSAAVFFGILTLVLLKRKYGREVFYQYRAKVHMIPAFFCAGLFLSQKLRKMRSQTSEEREIREVFLESPEEEDVSGAKRFSLMLLMGMSASLISFPLFLLQGRMVPVLAVRRPEFGETRQVDLVYQDEDGESPLRISVSGREPKAEEMDAVFDRIYAELREEMLQDNPDFLSVRTELKCPKETPEGVRIFVRSSRPEILSDSGMMMSKEIPEEGTELFLAICLRYGDYQKEYTEKVRVFPEEQRERTEKEALQAMIAEEDQDSRTQEVLRLPEEISGEPVRFYPARMSPYLVFAAAAVVSLWLFVFPRERKKEKLKKRKKVLEEAYAGFVLRLSILLRSGLSTRSAWERTLRNYEADGKKENTLAQEMKLALRNMDQGTPEDQAYLSFGERCGLSSYRRLGNFLAANLRYGLSGAREELSREVENALEEKRNTALRKGEEAGTKLLLPMFLLLIVVLVMIVVPAFEMLN